MGFGTSRVNRLQKFKYNSNGVCKECEDKVLKKIIEEVINTISDAPNTTNVYLQGYEDGYAKALDKVAARIIAEDKGISLDK